jgi:hypothetical protein
MMNRYRTLYPNHAHQIFVTPSKHLYALKDGTIKYQLKAMEAKLDHIVSADRNHLIHFIVADHYSSSFYAESHASKSLPDLIEFLKRAWSKKTDHFFGGIPQLVFLPDLVRNKFPSAEKFIHELKIQALTPTSGFQAGVHQVRNWEKELACRVTLFSETTTLNDLPNKSSEALIWAHQGQLNRAGLKLTRKQIWDLEFVGKPEFKYFENPQRN